MAWFYQVSLSRLCKACYSKLSQLHGAKLEESQYMAFGPLSEGSQELQNYPPGKKRNLKWLFLNALIV
jgi:hypothetical protein